jgi:hypothetical protein
VQHLEGGLRQQQDAAGAEQGAASAVEGVVAAARRQHLGDADANPRLAVVVDRKVQRVGEAVGDRREVDLLRVVLRFVFRGGPPCPWEWAQRALFARAALRRAPAASPYRKVARRMRS